VRRTIWYLAAWAAATLLSGTLAWVVVGFGGAWVSDARVHPMSAVEVAVLSEGDPASSTTSLAPTTSAGGTGVESAADSGEVTVHRVSGGTVILRVAQGALQLVSVTPEQGYRALIGNSGPHEVSIDLIGPGVESEFDAELVDGKVVVSSDEGGD
jgi:hypothetical protein